MGDPLCDAHHRRRHQQARQRTERDVTQRLGAHVRWKHVGRGHPHLLRGLHAHTEDQEREDQERKAMRIHRQADENSADERQRQADKDSGLAAIEVGDLADRIGHEKPAQAEQRDR